VASKQITLPDIGDVSLFKRRGSRTIRLTINPKGQVKVTMPYWVPYQAGIQFAKSKSAWIIEQTGKRDNDLVHGQTIGKTHRLLFEASPVNSKVSSRVNASIIRVTHPATCAVTDVSVQQAAQKAGIRALRDQAEELLPPRVKELAEKFGFSYRSLQVKQLTGRWGSCDSHNNLVFNLFLMELPWTLIDYVILHELVHTTILHHGPDFWAAMKRVLPDVQVRRKAMHQRRPAIGS
jgi:predicted metal-dependent hydrolase